MTTAFYRTGTVAVTQNSKVVTGTGTNWTTGPTKPLAGDVFIFNNKMYEIDSVVSDTEIRLYRNFEDSTASSKSYAIMRNASLNISARIAAQVAQVVNQKQIMIDEFHDFLTNNTDSTVPLTDTLGNTINVTPIPMLDKDYVEKIGGIDAAVNQAIQDINDKFDSYEYILMREAEARAIQWQNENVNFDASGFVHMGKHDTSPDYSTVNEGLTVRADSTYANTVLMGRKGDSEGGTSLTTFPMTHIAGAVSNIIRIDRSTTSQYIGGNFLLPEAEDGTRIYDSTGDCRGSGKASLDLKNEIDPKYGDIPTGTEEEILREAVGRAFEGILKNGDFRNGATDWTLGTGFSIIGSELVASNVGAYQTAASNVVTNSGEFIATIYCTGITSGKFRLYHRIGGSYGDFVDIVEGLNTVKFTATHGTDGVRVYSNEEGSSGTFSNLSVTQVSEEVVTHPVDLVGLEYYEEELTGRQEIFECIQSLSTTFGTTSVPTVLSTRKLSYFQQYDGQFPEVTADPDCINDRYRCVVWDDLTEPQKREVAAYMGEKLFAGVNGNIVNGRLRARTIRGLGNGDWANTDAVGKYTGIPANGMLRFDTVTDSYVNPQGREDAEPPYSNSSRRYKAYNDSPLNGLSGGAFVAADGNSESTRAYQGRCFMYVVATIPRANKGAYHPDLNPWGCALWARDSDGDGDINQFCQWYDATPHTTKQKTKQSAFVQLDYNDVTDAQGRYSRTGSISSSASGHPDGIFYDGIKAGGLNGVIDWRLSAYPVDTKEDGSKGFSKVVDGSYRGLEKLVWTEVINQELPNKPTMRLSSGGDSWTYFAITNKYQYLSNRDGFAIYSDGSVYKVRVRSDTALNLVWEHQGDINTDLLSKDLVNVVFETPLNISVSGELNTQMVIADPVNFLKVFPYGILGTWCPVIPDGTSKRFSLNRKNIGNDSVARQYTIDSGASWLVGTENVNATTNDFGSSYAANAVSIVNYTAFAKQTKPSTNKKVLNGSEGLGDVVQLARSDYSLMMESLIGKVGTSATSKDIGSLSVLSHTIEHSNTSDSSHGKLSVVSAYAPTHAPVDMKAPTNDSPAVKALWYMTSDNGQVGLNFAYNELVWNFKPVTQLTVGGTLPAHNAGDRFAFPHDLDNTALRGRVFSVIGGGDSITIPANWYLNYYVNKDNKLEYFNSSSTSNFAYIEPLTGWGDDSTVRIIDGQGTYINLNGDTCLYGTNELAIPLGWSQNKARFGTVTDGVDQ